MATVDTHQLIEQLVTEGWAKKPSEMLVKAFFSKTDGENFATKEQLYHLEKEQVDIKADIKIIQHDILVIKETMATKSDIAEVKNNIAEMKNSVLTWVISLFIGGLTINLAALGIVIAFLAK